MVQSSLHRFSSHTSSNLLIFPIMRDQSTFSSFAWAIAFLYSNTKAHLKISSQIAFNESSSVNKTLIRTAFIAKICWAFSFVSVLHFSSTLSQNSRISSFVSASLSGSNVLLFFFFDVLLLTLSSVKIYFLFFILKLSPFSFLYRTSLRDLNLLQVVLFPKQC